MSVSTRENSNSNRGVGFLGLLQIAFIVLKLCNVISWSWVAVLIPTWISIGLFFLVILVAVGVGLWEERKS